MENKEKFEKMLDELAKQKGFLDNIVDLLACTGDKKMLLLQVEHKQNKLQSQINQVVSTTNVPEECLDQLISLINQFIELTNNILKEYNIEL